MKTILETVTADTLKTMTREELRNLARTLGIKRGRNTSDTISNLNAAVVAGILHTKVEVSFCTRPNNPTDYRPPIYRKKFSTGKTPKVLVPLT